jgi:hypothetical protein
MIVTLVTRTDVRLTMLIPVPLPAQSTVFPPPLKFTPSAAITMATGAVQLDDRVVLEVMTVGHNGSAALAVTEPAIPAQPEMARAPDATNLNSADFIRFPLGL